jgi:hypothetical protein
MNDVNAMSEKDVNSRILIFHKSKTYTYIRNIFRRNFNGFILEIRDSEIDFKDDILGKIPIRKKEIFLIDYSQKKEVSEK